MRIRRITRLRGTALSLLGVALLAGACKDSSDGKGGDLAPGERYARKSKVSEASLNLKRISVDARMYFEEEHVTPEGTVPPRQFPPSAGPTPTPGSCCAGSGKRCQPRRDLWEAAGWRALTFALEDPHYCWYTFESSGTGQDATFTARANCDLDCDGTYSTFEMTGKVGPEGEVTVSDVSRQDEHE